MPAVRAGGAGNDAANALSLDAEGGITVAGGCSSPASFGGITLNGTTSNTMAYVARFASTALATHAPAALAEAFTLAPNPTAGLVHLSWPNASAAPRPVQLFDALGREVRRQQLPARTRAATLDVAGLAPGLYVVRCGPGASRLRVE